MSFITSPGIIVPPLTAGGVAYGTGSQAKVTSAGTVGQVLTSAGAGVPVFTTLAASSSGLTLVQTVNATPSASTVVVNGFSASYNNYKLLVSDVYPSADLRNFELKFYIASSLITGNYQYSYVNVSSISAGVSTDAGVDSNSTIRLANAMDQVTFNQSNQYEIDFYAVNGASTFKSIVYNGIYHFLNNSIRIMGAGTQKVTSGVLTGVEFTYPGSTFGGGKFQLYGYAPT